MVVPGYWANPEATAASFTAGFWHSGDLGSVDAAGLRAHRRPQEGHAQPRRLQGLFGRGRERADGLARHRRGGGRSACPARCSASACTRCCTRPAPRHRRRRAARATAPSGSPTTRCPKRFIWSARAAAAQRQRQGDEAAAARGLSDAVGADPSADPTFRATRPSSALRVYALVARRTRGSPEGGSHLEDRARRRSL